MHPPSSILHTRQRVKSYLATNPSSSNLEAARIIEDRIQKLLGFLSMKLSTLSRCLTQFITHSFWRLVFQSNPFAVQLIYFVAISFAGFLALKNLNPHGKPVLRDFDLMFTSVSTATVSSMATIQMEDLSDQQLWVLILLMLLGGEVFTSMVGFHLNNAKANNEELSWRSSSSISREIEASISANNIDEIDMERGQSEAVISHNQMQGKSYRVKGSKYAPLPSSQQLSVWALGKVSGKQEYAHILKHPEETGYKYLHTQRNSVYIFLTVTGLILLQVICICCFEWDANAFERMNWFKKLVSSLFQSVNTRQAGEAAVDISTFSSPTLLLFAIVMYLPSNISFLPMNSEKQPLADKNPSRRAMWKNFSITSLACIALFTFLACITERKSISADQLNFNVFSIVFEVISAFGNVGYSLGYSCEKLLKPDASCKSASYGFVGWWTNEGKLIIILVMFIGRLKKFIIKEEKLDCARTTPLQRVEVEAARIQES
ncbi:unnamed protein product [Urochloa humidicola]